MPFDFDGRGLLILEYLSHQHKQLRILQLDPIPGAGGSSLADHSSQFAQQRGSDAQNGDPANAQKQPAHGNDVLDPNKVLAPLHWEKEVDFISFVKKRGHFIVYAINHQNVHLFDMRTGKDELVYAHKDVIQALNVDTDGALDAESQQTLRIYSIDYNMVFICHQAGKVSKNINLYDISRQNEMIRDHKYIFDMGYPYYIVFNHGLLAFSSDIGVIVY